MEPIKCEMCGSNDIIKRDGLYVCNHCGTKYTVEEARKLMGTVKIDNSDRLKNLYQLARQYIKNLDFQNAAKYYDNILVDDPNSWEANFYTIFSKAMSCKIAEIGAYATLFANSIPGVLKLIKDNIPKDEQNSAVKDVATCCDALYREFMKGTYDFHYSYDDFVAIAEDGFKCCDGAAACGDAIEVQFKGDDEIVKNAIVPWKTCQFICDGLIELRPSKLDSYTLTLRSRQSYNDRKKYYQEKIDRVSDPESYRRREEEARKREEEARKIREEEAEERRKEYEASQPKTEEEKKLRKELEENRKYSTYMVIGFISMIIGIILCTVGFSDYTGGSPGIFLIICILYCVIYGAGMVYSGFKKRKAYKVAEDKLANYK